MAELRIALNDSFSGAIGAMVAENIEMNEDELAQAVAKAGDDAVKLLEERSRKRTYPKKGSYAKGWRRSEVDKRDGLGSSTVIHNVTKPSLTHLLEKDHPTNKGGRYMGDHVIEGVYEEVAKGFGKVQ